MQVELIHDEAGFFREFRIGYWRYVHEYETGQGQWYWEGSRAPAASRPAGRRDTGAIHMPEAPEGRVLRREDLSGLPSRARVQESHSWDALLKPDKASSKGNYIANSHMKTKDL